ncbi:MAG: hypothetical protein Q8M57_13025, partial [Nitrosomonas sp.]|uniref:hypothetical protein n=1 Tax=Nitrosomonas sp. TaxID=42353 RepID=UPI0027374033
SSRRCKNKIMNSLLLKKIFSTIKEILIKLISFMARQAHHEHNQCIPVRPEPVETLNQSCKPAWLFR